MNYKAKWFPLIVYILLLVPYLGSLGTAVFSSLGKYYYIIIGVLCLLYVVYSYIKYKLPINTSFNIFLLFFLLFYLAYNLIIKNSNDSFFFGLILFIFYEFCYISFKGKTLNYLGIIACIFLYVFFMISVVQKCTYFNPNSYAFISTQLFMFSLFSISHNDKLSRRALFLVNTLIAVSLVYFIYNSATQLICVLLFATFWIVRNHKLISSLSFFIVIELFVFGFVILLPYVAYELINGGRLTIYFFTNRGERWLLSIREIQDIGIFAISNKTIGAHNGFIEASLEYSLFMAIVYITFVFIGVLSTFNVYHKNKDGRLLVLLFTTYILMNVSESFFVGLTDSYFLIIPFVSVLNMKKKPVTQKSESCCLVYGEKITC